MQCTTAKEMWEKLEIIYERKSNINSHLLSEKFYNMKFEGSVNGFVTKLTNICAEMKKQGVEVPEKLLITKIIMSLPERYKHFCSAWDSTPTENQNLTYLTSILLIEEERVETVESEKDETVALVSKKLNKKCYSCGKVGHIKSECRKNVECYFCKKRGHKMSECFFKKRKQNEQQATNSMAMMVSNEINSQINTNWYLDSGASQHMYKNRNLIVNYRALDIPKQIKIGDGTVIKAIGVGNVNICAFNGKEFHDVTLHDVLLVPELEINLFSQGTTLDKGLSLVSNSESAKIIDYKKNVVAMAVRSGKLYKMLFKVNENCDELLDVTENCFVAKDKDLNWWH